MNHLFHDLLSDGPCKAKSVVGGGPSSKLVNDDKGARGGTLTGGGQEQLGIVKKLQQKFYSPFQFVALKLQPHLLLTLRMEAVSSISAMKVLTPFCWQSPAPTRAKIASRTEIRAESQGTKQPT